jgi:8-oxo-dGTP diphosphatase
MTDAGPLIVSAVALIDADGRVLVQQRPAGKSLAGLWEFPGGKVEAGETPEDALIRELEEELAIGVPCACLFPATFATDAGEARDLLLLLYTCRKWTGVPRALAAAALRWVRPAELHAMDLVPADRPMVAVLEALI